MSHEFFSERKVEVPDGTIQKGPQMRGRTSHWPLSDEKTLGLVARSEMSLVSGRRGTSDSRSHTVPGTCDDLKRALG